MHKEEIADCLDLMIASVELIESRFLNIKQPDEFVQSPDGITFLDAISMRLQVIGEKNPEDRSFSFEETFRY
jgi:uncharacterized protein with HEPN domain